MERIVHTKLYSYVEHRNIMDSEQKGFRNFHEMSMALLRVVQNIIDGFNEKRKYGRCVH